MPFRLNGESCKALVDRWRSVDLQRRSFGDIRAELRIELNHVIGIEGGLTAGSGNRYVSKAGIEEVRVDARVGIYQDALCSEALRAVAGDCIPVVKVRVLFGIKIDSAVIVKTCCNESIRRHRLDDR
jgi:hypothetical protein